MEINLKCKDFDAWVSFLGRLNKIGSGYFIKNDIILATIKGKKSGSNDKIPGRHIIKDPLFIDDKSCYVEDGVYGLISDLDNWISIFRGIKENNKDARKEIKYIRNKNGIYIRFNGGIEYKMFGLITPENIKEFNMVDVVRCSNGIDWFDNFMNTPKSLNSEWVKLEESDLIALRNGSPMTLKQVVSDKPLWSRIAKSVFTMSGVSRIGQPIAESAEYSMMPPKPDALEPIGMLDIHAKYKSPGGSKIITVESIHEYLILIYNEEA